MGVFVEYSNLFVDALVARNSSYGQATNKYRHGFRRKWT